MASDPLLRKLQHRDGTPVLSPEGKKRVAEPSPDAAGFGDWLATRPEGRRPTLQAVHSLIRQAAPELAVSLDGPSVNYGPFHYRYESGREGDTHRLVLRDNARYVSLYVLAGDEGGYLAEQRASTLGPKVKVGKSCVTFTKVDDVDLDALGVLVRLAADQHASEAGSG